MTPPLARRGSRRSAKRRRGLAGRAAGAAHRAQPTALLLLAGLAVALARLIPARRDPGRDGAVAIHWITFSPATGFALLLIAMGAALAFAVEFFYLRDNFGVRINTIFKFLLPGLGAVEPGRRICRLQHAGSADSPRPHIALR